MKHCPIPPKAYHTRQQSLTVEGMIVVLGALLLVLLFAATPVFGQRNATYDEAGVETGGQGR